jgi:LysM repeat protein
MIFSVKSLLAAALLTSLLVSGGCTSSSSVTLEEEKEPHFLEGKNRVNSMDYAGAIESFERALEVNPKSAAAHFELGCLCDQREADPAAAIFHFGRYLKLRPDGDKVERARSRITACKEQLARAVSLGPVTQGMQHEYEVLADLNKKLAEDNKKLVEENKALREKLNKNEAPASRAEFSSPSTASTSTAPAPNRLVVLEPAARAMGLRDSPSSRGAAAGGTRVHTVSSGETPLAIAKKYGIKVETLMAANPRLEPRRMRVGQTLAIPSL